MRKLLLKYADALETLSQNSRFYLFAAFAAVTGLIFWATIIHIGQVPFDGQLKGLPVVMEWAQGLGVTKEVGYYYALNWVVAPFTLALAGYFFLEAIRVFPDTLSEMARRKMLVTAKSFQVLQEDEVAQRVQSFRATAAAISLAVAIVVVAFVLFSDLPNSVLRYLNADSLKGLTLQDQVGEFDWSVSCLFATPPVDCASLKVFVPVAYAVIPCAMTALAFSTFFYVLFLSTFTFGPPGKNPPFVLLPDVEDSSDKRKGFQELGELFENLTFGLGMSLVSLYLMSLQNVYLRVPQASDILDFIASFFQQDITFVVAIAKGDLASLSGATDHATAVATSANSQSTIAMVIAIVICSLAGVTFYLTLRAAGRRARRDALQMLRARAATRDQEDAKQQIAELEQMEFWPVNWPTLTSLLIAALVMTVGTIRPSFVFLVLAGMGYIAFEAASKKFGGGKADKSDTEGGAANGTQGRKPKRPRKKQMGAMG